MSLINHVKNFYLAHTRPLMLIFGLFLLYFLLGLSGYGNDNDTALDEESELAVSNLLELEAGVSDNVLNSIPESSQWLATHFGRWRPSGRVKGNDEYFTENLPSDLSMNRKVILSFKNHTRHKRVPRSEMKLCSTTQ